MLARLNGHGRHYSSLQQVKACSPQRFWLAWQPLNLWQLIQEPLARLQHC